jgi:hypothetical protein
MSDDDYDSEHDSDVNMYMKDDVEAPAGVGLDGDVDIQWNGDVEDEEAE